MKREYPNAVQASRGQDCLKPNHFHLAGKVVYFVFWQFFFGELIPIIYCPKCGKVDRVCHDGWSIDKIRRVCSANAPAFLFSKVFRCGKGKKVGEGCPANGGKAYQFRSHDEGVLDQIRQKQPAVLEQLAIVFTRGGAIERSLLDTMVRNVVSGASIADQQRMVREAHMRTFTQHKCTYIQYAAARARRRQEQGGSLLFPGAVQQTPPAPADFGEYGDKDGYRGWIPSTSWIAGVILASLTSRLAFLERHLAAVDGMFWRGDHTFQAASRIRSADGRKDYAAIYSVMNEWSQIVGQWAVGDTSFDEYAPGIQDVLKRYDELGYQLPKFMWVDNSRTVAAQLYGAIPSLSRVLEDATHVLRRVFETIPDAHSLKADFCRDYSSAMFKIHQPDKRALREFLLDGGPGRRKWTQAEVAAKPASYWRARCRHTIPAPQELVIGVEAVMKKYAGGICAINGDPLVTEEVQRVHNLQLQLMQEGLLSDPLNVDEMYIPVSAPGCMPRYIGVRGCSSLEGYHRHLNALLGGGNYSPELAGALIALFKYRWNYECAVRSKGAKDWGMFDHWLLEAMQNTCADMGWPNPCPEWQRAPPTQERFGVHAAPAVLRAGVSQGDEEDEAGFLDQEAVFVENLLSEQELRSKQAAGAAGPAKEASRKQAATAVCAPQAGPSSPPPGQNREPAAARPSPPEPSFDRPGQIGQPATACASSPAPFFVPPGQNEQPAPVRTAQQDANGPAQHALGPEEQRAHAPQQSGPPSVTPFAAQLWGQASQLCPPSQSGPPPVVPAPQLGGQPPPRFVSPGNEQAPVDSAAPQRSDGLAPCLAAAQNGQPADVSAASQLGGQFAPHFAPSRTGSLLTFGASPPLLWQLPKTSSLPTSAPGRSGGLCRSISLSPPKTGSLPPSAPHLSRGASPSLPLPPQKTGRQASTSAPRRIREASPFPSTRAHPRAVRLHLCRQQHRGESNPDSSVPLPRAASLQSRRPWLNGEGRVRIAGCLHQKENGSTKKVSLRPAPHQDWRSNVHLSRKPVEARPRALC
ncbi:hypothetical protein KFL_001770280 [Klebsormidium nitens]|uniref:Uncharacterized protein n=1 Tax=Klebsormidium nitens TaxID=105231 RepID=A0A1Y1I2F3_KLENI|nr:hypothetical protein KFL_001770280 [Klebsormidium nitens]|eukprot:GAQ84142.1 hypothetical protein KFL_001770280 [Klebsormidium nitens]